MSHHSLPADDSQAILVNPAQHPHDPRFAVMPGSFNPVHDAHWALAKIAADILGVPVEFELSVLNVDKPMLAPEEVERRLQPLTAKIPVWLTRAPTFLQKARLFPGRVFVVGADTAERVLNEKYYRQENTDRASCFKHLSDVQCSFLVAARASASGKLIQLSDLDIPRDATHLFRPIPAELFAMEMSSTALRKTQSQC